MITLESNRPRAFAVYFKDLHVWGVKSFLKQSWHWPTEFIKPLSTALNRVQEEVKQLEHPFKTLQLVTLRFDGSMEPRALKSSKRFKGKLYFASAGDVIYSKIDVRNGAIGIVPDHMPRVAVTSEFPVYRVEPEQADSGYIKLLFRTSFFRQTINSMVSGASGRKRVQPGQIESLNIPLPPLDIQQAIVGRWNEAQNELRVTMARVASLEVDLVNKFYKELSITPPEQVTRPKFFAVQWPHLTRWSVGYVCDALLGLDTLPHSSYPYTSVGDVAKVSYGIQKSPSNRPGQHARPYLRVANVRKGYLDLTEIKKINVPDNELEAYKLIPGDILFVEGNGSRTELGRVAMWKGEIEDCVHQNHLIKVRVNQGALLPEFAMFWFNTELGRGHFFRSAKTSSGLGTINSDEVRGAPIPLPPLNIQQAIVDKIKVGQADIERARESATLKTTEIEAELEALILGTKQVTGTP